MLQLLKDVVKVIADIDNTDLIIRDRLGIPLSETRRLRKRKGYGTNSMLFKKPIRIADNFWHHHSLREIFLEEVYRFNTSSESPLIIDCGANIGLSVIYFKKLFPKSRVIAFEPDKEIFRMLESNLAKFDNSFVMLNNKAVWKDDAILDFCSLGSLSSKLVEHENNSTLSDMDEMHKVEAVKLSAYLQEKVDFLKIDIEGAEVDVLKDCSQFLHNVENIFVEYHSDPQSTQQLPEILTILREAGFRIYIREAWNNLPFPYEHKNYNPFWDLQLNIFGYRKPFSVIHDSSKNKMGNYPSAA